MHVGAQYICVHKCHQCETEYLYLGRFGKNQEIQFNWKAAIDTGSRSKVIVFYSLFCYL